MKPGNKEVWYECHDCGYVSLERISECPRCYGSMERRSRKK